MLEDYFTPRKQKRNKNINNSGSAAKRSKSAKIEL